MVDKAVQVKHDRSEAHTNGAEIRQGFIAVMSAILTGIISLLTVLIDGNLGGILNAVPPDTVQIIATLVSANVTAAALFVTLFIFYRQKTAQSTDVLAAMRKRDDAILKAIELEVDAVLGTKAEKHEQSG
jgi:cellobiose-specific phosphotransferase system component IIC